MQYQGEREAKLSKHGWAAFCLALLLPTFIRDEPRDKAAPLSLGMPKCFLMTTQLPMQNGPGGKHLNLEWREEKH